MEKALHDTPMLRRFAQLGGLDAILDETTILNARRLLETYGLAGKMLAWVNVHLAREGLSLRAGMIVDATIIAAPSSTRKRGRRTRSGNAPDEEGQPVPLRGEGANRM